MDIARHHEEEAKSQRPDNRFAMRRNSPQTKKQHGPAITTYGESTDSAPVESPDQHYMTQHLPYHQQTPVSRKTKKGQQNQRHAQQQTQHN